MIGENLEKIRKFRGFTREKVEHITGIKNLYQKEKGIRGITNNDIIKLINILGCSKTDLTGETTEYLNNEFFVEEFFDCRFFETLQKQNFINKEKFNQYLKNIKNFIVYRHSKNVIDRCDFFDKKSLASFFFKGHYMYPSITDGSYILFDFSNDEKINSNHLYLILENEKIKIRRIKQPKPDIDNYVIRTDKEDDFESIQYNLNYNDLLSKLLGKIILIIKYE
jgi:transcriptional regulator with XRE-family HTH domain